jgi:Tfp pilus assembly protein PilO
MAANPSLNTPYVVLSGTVLVAIAAFFLLFQPMVEEITNTQSEIRARELTLQEREQFLRTIDRKSTELQAHREHEQRLAVILPDEERIEDALRIIHNSSQVAGVAVERVTNNSGSVQARTSTQRARGEAVNLPDDVMPLSFSITFEGTYQQFRAFASELERAPRLMNISHINMSRTGEGAERLSGTMVIEFYTQEARSALDL